MKRSKDINIYEIRLNEAPSTWNIDISIFLQTSDDGGNPYLLKYDYVRIIMPAYLIRKLIPFNQFNNFIQSSVGSCISINDCFTEDGTNTVIGYLEITAINDNIATVQYNEM